MNDLAFSYFQTPLGDLAVLANNDGLLFARFRDCLKQGVEKECPNYWENKHKNEHVDRFRDELDQYFSGHLKSFRTPCSLAGTNFQILTWRALELIPYAQTVSYGQVAESIHRPTAYRAVAAANRANRFAIRIPCHRVIKSNGHLCGYNGGVHRKQWLLDHEKKYV